jgi:hypothetical protein
MGENSASGEGILGGVAWKGAHCVKGDNLSIKQNSVYMHSIYLDKVKYVHSKRFGYNKCEFIHEVALMVKLTNGEKKYDC